MYICEGRITEKERGKQIHFLWAEKATGSRFVSGGAAVTQHCLCPRLKLTSSHCYPPPVKLTVHLLGSHSSLCSPERDNWIPHLWPQPHWWMALMGFYCLMYPLSSSFFSKSNLLSLYLFTLSAHELPFYLIFSFVFIFHLHFTCSALQWDTALFPPLMGLSFWLNDGLWPAGQEATFPTVLSPPHTYISIFLTAVFSGMIWL